jgi:hypothetical protein
MTGLEGKNFRIEMRKGSWCQIETSPIRTERFAGVVSV